MDLDEALIEQVHDASTPVYALTKAELIAYYQKLYPANWQRRLSEDLAPIAGAKPESIARRFQPRRKDQTPSVLAQAQYEILGEEIGPIEWEPPDGGYEITFAGGIDISQDTYDRSFTVTLSGNEAWAFAQNPSVMTVLQKYANGLFVPLGYDTDSEIEVA